MKLWAVVEAAAVAEVELHRAVAAADAVDVHDCDHLSSSIFYSNSYIRM